MLYLKQKNINQNKILNQQIKSLNYVKTALTINKNLNNTKLLLNELVN